MTPNILTAMMWSGITPPKPGSNRTTCPKCSHTRTKHLKRCLLITETSPGTARAFCHHCTWEIELT